MPTDDQHEVPGGASAASAAPAAPAAHSTRRRHPALAVLRGFFEWAKSLSLALLLFLVIRSFLVEAFKIPSGSMEGTLLIGDFLLVNKLVYGAEVPFTGKRLPAMERPKYGDILVFQWPVDRSKNLVKRLVGLPGDTIAMENGLLVRNGAPQHERYALHTDPDADPAADDFHWQSRFLVRHARALHAYRPSRNNWGPLVVPSRSYFVLGDNRDNSLDSRYWGFVPDSLLRGRPMIVYYSYAPDTATALDWLTRIRWGRLGEHVR